MDTNELEVSIVQCGEQTPVETLLQAGDQIARLGEFHRQVKQMWEAKMVEHINRHGPVEVGDVRYYVGTVKKTKCLDVPGTVEALLSRVEGDFGRFCEHLSTGAVKYGAARETLAPDDFDRLFVTEVEQDLKEGKPVKRLQKADQRFIGK